MGLVNLTLVQAAQASGASHAHKHGALQDLPAELLLAIVSHLDRASLVQVSRVCRRLYEATQPELYSHPLLEKESADAFKASLERDPSLAQHVTSLTVHYMVPGTAETALCRDACPSDWVYGPAPRVEDQGLKFRQLLHACCKY